MSQVSHRSDFVGMVDMGPEPSVFLMIHMMYVPIYPPNENNAGTCLPLPMHKKLLEAPLAFMPFVFDSSNSCALCCHILAICFD